MCERSRKRLTRSCSTVEIKDNVTEPVQFPPVTQFDSPCTSVQSVSTLSPVCLIPWFMMFLEGNASSSSDMWLAKYAELKYQNKLLHKGARLSWWHDPVMFPHSVSRIIIQFKQLDVIMTQFQCTSLGQHYTCDTVKHNVVQQILWIVMTSSHANWWCSGEKAKWYRKKYYTNTTWFLFQKFP